MTAIKEIFITESPYPFSIEQTETILNQMKKSVCKICQPHKIATGFFCKIPYYEKNLTVLITNNHVIDQNYYNNNKEIILSCFNDKNIYTLDLKKRRNYLFSKKYDTTIIEIFKDEVKGVEFLELDYNINAKNYNKTLVGNTLYIIQYINGENVVVSYGLFKNEEKSGNNSNFIFSHLCHTDSGSSGSPIFLHKSNKIIGIHYGGFDYQNKENNYNIGIFLKYPIAKFIKKLAQIEKDEKEQKEKEKNEKENNENKTEKGKLINKNTKILQKTKTINVKNNTIHNNKFKNDFNSLNKSKSLNNSKSLNKSKASKSKSKNRKSEKNKNEKKSLISMINKNKTGLKYKLKDNNSMGKKAISTNNLRKEYFCPNNQKWTNEAMNMKEKKGNMYNIVVLPLITTPNTIKRIKGEKY